jgi:hypothetical protein
MRSDAQGAELAPLTGGVPAESRDTTADLQCTLSAILWRP